MATRLLLLAAAVAALGPTASAFVQSPPHLRPHHYLPTWSPPSPSQEVFHLRRRAGTGLVPARAKSVGQQEGSLGETLPAALFVHQKLCLEKRRQWDLRDQDADAEGPASRRMLPFWPGGKREKRASLLKVRSGAHDIPETLEPEGAVHLKAAKPKRGVAWTMLLTLSVYQFLLTAVGLVERRTREAALTSLHFSWDAAVMGGAGMAPLVVVALGLQNVNWKWAKDIDNKVRDITKTFFGDAGWPSVLAGSLILGAVAGIGEEMLFRGAIQCGLQVVFGVPAIYSACVSALIFGLCHFVSPMYALLATVAGAYFSFLWSVTGNLLVPIVTHIFYDVFALIAALYSLRHEEAMAGVARGMEPPQEQQLPLDIN